MVRPGWSIGAVLLMLLSGCASTGSEPPSGPEEPLYSDAPPAPAKEEGNWTEFDDAVEGSYVMPASGVAGFSMPIPEGRSHNAGSSRYFVLYAEPYFPAGSGDAVVVVLLDGEPALLGHWGSYSEIEPVSGDRDARIDHGVRHAVALDTGQSRFQVVVASTQEAYVALHFGRQYDSIGTADRGIQSEARLLSPNGTGRAFEFHQRTESFSTLDALQPMSSIQERGRPEMTGPAVMAGAGGVRATSTQASCDLGGASVARTSWFGALEDTTHWTHTVTAGPAEWSAQGVHTSVVLFDTIVSQIVFGFPDGFAIGDGAASATLDLNSQYAPLLWESFVEAACFDTPWKDLVGEPIEARARSMAPPLI